MEELEIWKPVLGYEDSYEVSNLGKLRSRDRFNSRGYKLKGKLLSQHYSHKGYIIVALCKDNARATTSIHRLMAQAFIPNPDNKSQINHLNGIKDDNRLENIEWATQEENMRHAYDTGLKTFPVGELNSNTTLSEEDVANIIDEYNKGKTLPQMSEEKQISLSILRGIIYGKSWTHHSDSITKRDDRANWTKEHSKNSILSKFANKTGRAIITVGQYTIDGKELARFRSIKQAADITGVPKVSISAVIHETKFYNKDKTTYFTMKKAGGFIWKKLDLTATQLQELL